MPRAEPINKLSETVTVEEESSLAYPLTPENTPKMGQSTTDFFVSSGCQIIEDSMSPAARKAFEEENAISRRHQEQGKGRKLSIPFSPTSKQRSTPYFSDSDEDDKYTSGLEHGSPSAMREKTRPASKPNKATNRGSVALNQQADWDAMMARIRKDRAAALKNVENK
ncbi:hypothetical protein HBH56_147130 [Parastagonospora nodorum]|uniref:Uncharacterized protein n=2 Tax=Phaeosphaeria nodorum (strain SN15 / ATCC MYA-4574 / FGSC 10173) TaxID=321614 RepID=A0A7U2EW53_PHANO|nr:hypothetical protein SNOG_07297 [Parastagonospora nodorum SN15]KAH3910100.1 hypothetical protein HBH56_147130 [Parastagonospora nodorum]EAT84763.2 hypothetical protein SNOG_07297 [Parastagonospora nodorum SN15]KAH3923338.1 hypothetical protein HBH54_211770 [Parastagonospora nodorum]KAH3945915.1 hypothetical protein HBH53_134590 [Parastagonospora nodorum]KAH3983950.1 hypothetical protein HBH52_065450 [Parastagonospora nodorum]